MVSFRSKNVLMIKENIKSALCYFGNHFVLGAKYALVFMLAAALMGFIYGALGGIWVAPPFVSISYVGIFVVVNFVFALVLGLLNLLLGIFGKGSKRLFRYFTFSLAFALVFLSYFAILKFSGFEPF